MQLRTLVLSVSLVALSASVSSALTSAWCAGGWGSRWRLPECFTIETALECAFSSSFSVCLAVRERVSGGLVSSTACKKSPSQASYPSVDTLNAERIVP